MASIANSLNGQMDAHTGYYVNKIPDWDAFPPSRGYPELDRAQIRYIGAGGSPKIDDPSTLKPGSFTLSIVHQPVGKYGASHAHEVEEAFLVLDGVLTVGWEWDGEVVFARLGPKDMILHAVNRPHGFANEGFDPVKVSIMVGKARPAPPHYLYHPKTHSSELSRAFGAKPGKSHPISFTSDDPKHQEMARHIIRYSQKKMEWLPAGIGRIVYVGEGGAPAGPYRKDLIEVPGGVAVKSYERDVEDAYFVMEGVLTVGWEENGERVEKRIGPKDMVFNPPGRRHYFRNDDRHSTQFMMVVGTPKSETVTFEAA